MKVYIAGSITNNPNYKEEFNQAEEVLKQYGFIVLNPIKEEGFTYKEYIDMGLNELMCCDAICLLNEHYISKGACLEMKYAGTVGMKIIYFDDLVSGVYKC